MDERKHRWVAPSKYWYSFTNPGMIRKAALALAEKKFTQIFGSRNDSTRWMLTSRSLSDLSVGVLGLGEIGSHVAKTCKGLGMAVWGVGRSERPSIPNHVDHYRTLSSLAEVLQSCDYICNVLPSTQATRYQLSGNMLKNCMGRGSVFINIGRGDFIDEKSLVDALKQNWISGAILDVFESEPLSPTSELWDIPQVTISPHYSGIANQKEADSKVKKETVGRFCKEEERRKVESFVRVISRQKMVNTWRFDYSGQVERSRLIRDEIGVSAVPRLIEVANEGGGNMLTERAKRKFCHPPNLAKVTAKNLDLYNAGKRLDFVIEMPTVD